MKLVDQRPLPSWEMTLVLPELITMHQLLRLIYSDQETPSGELFRSEKFDPAITRAAVGDYLLGIDANELYELRLRENTLEKQLAEIKSGIRTIYTAFGSSGTDISLDFLQDRINNLSLGLRGLHEKLDNGIRTWARKIQRAGFQNVSS